MRSIQEYIDQLLEVNRIVQGLAKRSGKPADHINSIWKDTDREIVGKHQYGVTDKQKVIAKIVRDKLGVKPDSDEDNESKDE
jgi:hypothetical protein